MRVAARWAELVARECAADFAAELDKMIADASRLDSIANLDELMRQKGYVMALNQLRLKVTSLNQTDRRR